MPRTQFSFCEPAYAGSGSAWCIRKLTDIGQKLGGGIDTDSLCGHVKAGQGWDLKVKITQHHLGHSCKQCIELFKLFEPDTFKEIQVLGYLENHGRVYSREIHDGISELTVPEIQKILKRLREAGVLDSDIVNPPHDGQRGGGMQRRYYWIKR